MPDFPAIAGGAIETASTPASSVGITLTSSGSTNTKGSWTQLLATTAYPTAWVLVTACISNNTLRQFFLDLGVGASTAEKVLLPDLYYDCRAITAPANRAWLFPLSIPAGVRLSARVACNVASGTLSVTATLIAATLGSGHGHCRAETLGATAASTTGVAMDPGGTAHTDSSWVLATATTFPWKWACLSLGHTDVLAALTHWLVDIGIGAGGSEKVLVSDLPMVGSFTTDTPTPGTFCFPLSVPASASVSLRTRSTSIVANERVINATLTGVG